MRSNKDTIIIENALKQLFSNVSGSLESSFRMWREKSRVLEFQEKLNTNKKNTIMLRNEYERGLLVYGMEKGVEHE